MVRHKNALRKHDIAAWTTDEETPKSWMPLAKNVTNITDDSDDEIDDSGDYAGDGSPGSDVISVSEVWTVVGTYDDDQESHAFLKGIKRQVGDARRVWHRITYPNGEVYQGVANASDIVAGGGEATEYGALGAKLTFIKIPELIDPEEV